LNGGFRQLKVVEAFPELGMLLFFAPRLSFDLGSALASPGIAIGDKSGHRQDMT